MPATRVEHVPWMPFSPPFVLTSTPSTIVRNGHSRAEKTFTGATLCLAVLLAILTSALLSIRVQDILPSWNGPAYALLHYGDEVVGIALTGAILPVSASVLIVLAVVLSRRLGSGKSSHRPFVSLFYWLILLIISLIATLVFAISQDLYGGLTLPKSGTFWTGIVGAGVGIGYWYLRGRRLTWWEGAAECYVMGALGMFGSDIVRTFTGLASAPGEALVWGGGGFHDLVFWFGIYAILSLLALRLYLPPLVGLSRVLPRGVDLSPQARAGLPTRFRTRMALSVIILLGLPATSSEKGLSLSLNFGNQSGNLPAFK